MAAAALRSDELVQVSRLEVRITEGGIEQRRRQRGRPPIEIWRRVKRLGQGGFATVYLERNDNSEQPTLRAVKQLRKAMGPSKLDYRRELEAAALFSHEKYRDAFVRSFGWYETDDHIYLTMEYLALGDFSQYLGRRFPIPEARSVVQQILTALEFMHERDFVHRDLKPANLLVCQVGPDWWIKVTDFGISKRATAGDTALNTHAYYTEQYAAPEIRIAEGSYTRAVDIWSTGIITYNLLTAKAAPFHSAELWRYYHESEEFPTQRLKDLGLGTAASQFVGQLLSSVPEMRPTAKECLEHGWLETADVHDDGPSDNPVGRDILPDMDALTMISEGEQFTSWTTRKSEIVKEDTLLASTPRKSPDQPRACSQPRITKKMPIPRQPSSHPLRQDKETKSDMGRFEPWSTRQVLHHTTRSWRHLGLPDRATVCSIAFSPHGRQLASGSHSGTIRLWDTTKGALLQTLTGHTNNVRSVAFSPDGKQLASGSDDGSMRLWDGITGVLLQTLKGHSNSVRFVAFSPDNTRLASVADDRTVRLWSVATGALLMTFKAHMDLVLSVAFSPNGKRLASGSDDGTVRLWNAARGASLLTLMGHTFWVVSVAFSPDSTRLASGSADGTLRLWDTSTGAPLQTLGDDRRRCVNSVAFSPDGKWLAGSVGNDVRLWNPKTGALLQTLQGHTAVVTAIAFSPDGTQLASASYDATVRLWTCETAR